MLAEETAAAERCHVERVECDEAPEELEKQIARLQYAIAKEEAR